MTVTLGDKLFESMIIIVLAIIPLVLSDMGQLIDHHTWRRICYDPVCVSCIQVMVMMVSLSKYLKGHEKKITDLEFENNRLRETQAFLQNRVCLLEDQANSLGATVRDLEEDTKSLTRQLTAKDSMIRSRISRILEQSAKIMSLNNLVAVKDATILSLNKRVTATDTDNRSLKKYVADTEEETDILKTCVIHLAQGDRAADFLQEYAFKVINSRNEYKRYARCLCARIDRLKTVLNGWVRYWAEKHIKDVSFVEEVVQSFENVKGCESYSWIDCHYDNCVTGRGFSGTNITPLFIDTSSSEEDEKYELLPNEC